MSVHNRSNRRSQPFKIVQRFERLPRNYMKIKAKPVNDFSPKKGPLNGV